MTMAVIIALITGLPALITALTALIKAIKAKNIANTAAQLASHANGIAVAHVVNDHDMFPIQPPTDTGKAP